MTEPFDPDHILDLGYKKITIDYDYHVSIITLESGREDRNLERERGRYIFSVSFESADSEYYQILMDSFDKARGGFEGFYFDHGFLPQLIPVRFNSPFRLETEDAECCGNWWMSIQSLELIEVLDQPRLNR